MGGWLLHRVQLPRFFGLSAAGASFLFFSRGWEGRAGQGPDSKGWKVFGGAGRLAQPTSLKQTKKPPRAET